MKYTIPIDFYKYLYKVWRFPAWSLIMGWVVIGIPTWYLRLLVLLLCYTCIILSLTIINKLGSIVLDERGIKRGMQKIVYTDIIASGLVTNARLTHPYSIAGYTAYKPEIKELIEIKSDKTTMLLPPVGAEIIFDAIKAGKNNNLTELKKVLMRSGSTVVTLESIIKKHWEIPLALSSGHIFMYSIPLIKMLIW